MKKIILLLMVVLTTTICANAQMKIGILNRTLKKYFDKGDDVLYTETQNGKVKIFVDYREMGMTYEGTYAKNVVSFSGYYYGEVTDPRDDYVNIRKGPGTNYQIVEKAYIGNRLLIKKTDSNWYKVYGIKGDHPTQYGSWDISNFFQNKGYNSYWYCIGYIYKDRIVTPRD